MAEKATLERLLEWDKISQPYEEKNDFDMCRCLNRHWWNIFKRLTADEQEQYWAIQECMQMEATANRIMWCG